MYYSVVLGGKLHLRVTTMAQRLIKDAGGFDRYIYYTSDEELKYVFLSPSLSFFLCISLCYSPPPPPLIPSPLPFTLEATHTLSLLHTHINFTFPSLSHTHSLLPLSFSLPLSLRSELALTLKRRMQSLVATHPTAEPPPLDKRNPKPLPRKLPLDIKRVEVVQTIKYQFLG